MISPNFDSRETVSVIHSFMEQWSIIFFVILVTCDVILHLFGEKIGPTWPIKWEKKSRLISWGKHSLNIRFPACSSTLGLKSLTKLLGMISFALAISLEVIGYPYGKRNDELANKEIAASQVRASEGLRKASVAAVQVVGLQKEAARLGKIAEDERLARIKLVTALNPRSLSDKDLKGIAEECRPFAKSTIKVEVFTTSGNGLRLGIQIWNALKDAGFTQAELKPPSTQLWYEVNVSGPPEYEEAVEAVVRALAKRLVLWGFEGILPPG